MKVNLNSAFLAFSLMFSMSLAAQSTLNTLESSLKWEGKKITGSGHNGSLTFLDSEVKLENGNIKSGVFTVDMTTLTCDDLTANQGKAKLEGHLKSKDFFGIEKFPIASLAIKKAIMKTENHHEVTAELTIKGITNPIIFDMHVENNEAMAKLSIDRTKYDIRYRSNSFFDNLGDIAINNEFDLDIKLKF